MSEAFRNKLSFGVLGLCAASLLALAVARPARAVEEEPRLFRGIRSEGMGGLITTTGNYSEALFGNPARHSEVDTWKFTMLEIMAEANDNFLGDSGTISNLKAASGPGVISSAASLIGKNEHLLLQLMSAYYNPNFIGDLGFAFGLYASTHDNLTVDYTTNLDTQAFVDIGPNFGFSHPFLDNRLSVGMNIHFIYRIAVDENISSTDFLTGGKLTLQRFGKQGMGADADLGAYYHIPWELPFMRVAVGASLNNIAKSHYDDVRAGFLAGLDSRPTNNDRLFNYGFRFEFPDWSWFSAPIFAVEIQDNGDAQKRISFAKKTHIGAEAKLSRVFSVRLGLNQGYATAGLGIDLPVVKLDFATYGEELAGNAGEREDRRFAFRLAFEL